jgi:hypothetical protein
MMHRSNRQPRQNLKTHTQMLTLESFVSPSVLSAFNKAKKEEARFLALVEIGTCKIVNRPVLYRNIVKAQGTRKGAQKLLNGFVAVRSLKKEKGKVPGVKVESHTFTANKYL